MAFNIATNYVHVFHDGQELKRKQTCSKCLEEGHSFKECINEWKCRKCQTSGHKQDQCESLGEPHNSENVNKPIKTKDDNKQNPRRKKVVQAGQKQIDFFLSNTQSQCTPNKNKPKISRSPPTPAELLNTDSKKLRNQIPDEDVFADATDKDDGSDTQNKR